MIKRWKIANFKSIRDETTLDLAPLTIFAGANSSGKSTVIQSILLIAQTLQHKISSKPIVLNGSLSKLGKFDDLKSDGSDVDQISIGWHCEPDTDQRGEQINSVKCELSFDANQDSFADERNAYQLQPRLHRFELKANLTDHNFTDHDVFVYISSSDEKYHLIEKKNNLADEMKVNFSINIDIDDNSWSNIQERLPLLKGLPLLTGISCSKIDHFLPKTLQLNQFKIDEIDDVVDACISVICGESLDIHLFNRLIKEKSSDQLSNEIQNEILLPVATLIKLLDTYEIDLKHETTFRESLDDLNKERISLSLGYLADFMKTLDNDNKTQREIQDAIKSDNSMTKSMSKILIKRTLTILNSKDFTILDNKINKINPKFLSSAMEYIDSFFSEQVKYLGPLRSEPKYFYPIGNLVDPDDVGLRGEQTAAVLHVYRKASIKYLPSSRFPLANSELSEIKRTPVSKPLEEAVQDWANYLGVAGEVQTSDLGKFGHDLTVGLDVGSDGRLNPRNLTHVGVGVSQVLPILVMGLLSKEDTTLIFEQPELHLHPLVQTRLADFFLSMALLKKQCIIETHSEHLINRLRFRAATASVEESLTDTSKIYFVEKVEGTSRFKEVIVNEYGSIQDWPSGFFDQSYSEAENILMASIKKRKKMRKDK